MKHTGIAIRLAAEGASIDLGKSADRDAESILQWPDPFLHSLKHRLLALRSGSGLSAEELAELKVHGLLDENSGKTTALGERLVDLVVREGWQEGAERRTFREMILELGVASVVEIGCSSGWVLRSLGPESATSRLGVDVDAVALALAYRFSRQEGQDCRFYCCSAYSLPFDDVSIDCIIFRNTLTYMHQRAALKEMSRVLKADGIVFLRFENLWYDLRRVVHARNLRTLGSSLRDLGLGLIHAVAGWQPHYDSRLRWGRLFVAVPRLRRILRECGCEILQIDESFRCPRFLGFSTQTSILIRRDPTSSR